MRHFAVLAVVTLALVAGPARAEETPAATERREMPVSLEECIRLALEGNLQVQISGYGPGIASTRVTEAESEFDQLLTFQTRTGYAEQPTSSEIFGAPVLIDRTFGADIVTTRKLMTGGQIGLGYGTGRLSTNSFFSTLDPAWDAALFLDLRQPLLRGGWQEYNRSRIELAEKDREIAREELEVTAQDVIVQVETAYWNLVFARADVDVRQASLRVAEEFLKTTRRRIEAEKATRVDETQALTGVENRRFELITAENDLGNAEDALRSLLLPFQKGDARSLTLVPTDVPTPAESEVLPEEQAVEVALERQPALTALRKRIEARGIDIDRAENELLPRLDLFGRAQLNALEGNYGSTWESIFGADNIQWEVGLSLEVPLGNRAARSRLLRSELERRRERSRLDDLRNVVIVEVRRAIRGVLASRQSMEAAARALALAEEQLANEQIRLKAGVTTPFQVLQIEEDLVQARSREIGSRTAHRVALVRYFRAIGTLSERYRVDLRSLESGSRE
jgi:outer membrane protein